MTQDEYIKELIRLYELERSDIALAIELLDRIKREE